MCTASYLYPPHLRSGGASLHLAYHDTVVIEMNETSGILIYRAARSFGPVYRQQATMATLDIRLGRIPLTFCPKGHVQG